MRGYVSFLLVLASSLLLLQLLSLNHASKAHDLSKAISIERTYMAGMDAKAASMEAIRQGARIGFEAYDTAHDAQECAHCPDHGCIPSQPGSPPAPNTCDPVLCSRCFRESEARASAELSALEALRLLDGLELEGGFSFTTSPCSLQAFTAPDPSSKNKIALDSLRLSSDLTVEARSDLYGIWVRGTIPRGRQVDYERPDID